jgi:hypothetical protein
MSVLLPVCPHETTRLPLGGFSLKFDIEVVFENPSRKLEFHENLTRINEYFT